MATFAWAIEAIRGYMHGKRLKLGQISEQSST
jgi:hypothetical protein